MELQHYIGVAIFLIVLILIFRPKVGKHEEKITVATYDIAVPDVPAYADFEQFAYGRKAGESENLGEVASMFINLIEEDLPARPSQDNPIRVLIRRHGEDVSPVELFIAPTPMGVGGGIGFHPVKQIR
ncbi:hypothetical protein [Dyella telluris]|uniref:Uncharacterized protein n=1 Tax=Dyella telluris TaxID=2763498 RepID=A0A7G8Q4H7_9GAMM|nr:hypothetical protein [Dyella telluris]QNK01685.1 hypothetical protein H8F01_00450 [Dyella telluris]